MLKRSLREVAAIGFGIGAFFFTTCLGLEITLGGAAGLGLVTALGGAAGLGLFAGLGLVTTLGGVALPALGPLPFRASKMSSPSWV